MSPSDREKQRKAQHTYIISNIGYIVNNSGISNKIFNRSSNDNINMIDAVLRSILRMVSLIINERNK